MRPELTMADAGGGAATGTSHAVLGLGCAPLGNLFTAIDDDTARATVDAAWDCGIRYFDTAPHYGLGLSELRLGAALSGRPRASYQLSTKVGRLIVPNPEPTGSDLSAGGFDVPGDLTRRRDYSRDGVRRSVEESLHRLGTDYVDIAYIHDPEDVMDQAVTETVAALAELRDEGVVCAIGVGMNFVEPLRRFVRETPVDVVMVAGRWTLLDRSARSLLDEAASGGVSVVVAGPFNSGLLATNSPADGATFDYAPAGHDLVTRARELASAASAVGVPLPAAALQSGTRRPEVAAVVAGLRSPHEVRAARANWDVRIPQRLWVQLDEIAGAQWQRPPER
ncbi:aldo/keto reductase [Flexivirga oryzae]|uniref:D-threo-aldose 1-dehydrogenase n=1 Tax=Flexivirga oryzae TaxID=1794944 RepID=A0A839N5G9_9MICO|nr:aldo/keto reductase [Flexivirga oryzae]MBB2892990.1 D-threo-aldose 1-dehydrogenase [Flexivirga oryzae]